MEGQEAALAVERAFEDLLSVWQQAIYEQGESGSTLQGLARTFRLWLGDNFLGSEIILSTDGTRALKFLINVDVLCERIKAAARDANVQQSFTILALVSSIEEALSVMGTPEADRAAHVWQEFRHERLPPRLWMADFDHRVKRSTNFSST